MNLDIGHEKREILAAVIHLGVEPWHDRADWHAVANLIGSTRHAARGHYRRLMAMLEEADIPLETLLKELNINFEEYERQWVARPAPVRIEDSKPDPAEKPGRIPLSEYLSNLRGLNVGTVRLDAEGRVIEAYGKSPEVASATLLEDLKAALLAEVTPLTLPPHEDLPQGNILAVPAIFDLHLEKQAPNWSPGIARETYITTLRKLLAKASQAAGRTLLDTVVLTIGQDFGHYDTVDQTTTAGTHVGGNGPAELGFRQRVELAIQAVFICGQWADKVHVVMVSGNHDTLTNFALGEVIRAKFDLERRVSVNNEPHPRKYFAWGNTLLGITHGDKEKLEDLLGLMTHEARSAWGNAEYAEWLCGHFHRRSNHAGLGSQKGGVYVRFMPSLSPRDRWHEWAGYLSVERAGEVLIYDQDGFCGSFVQRV